MGFKKIRQEVIKRLESGAIQHEARGSIDEKNLLSTGEVSAEEVVKLLRQAKGSP